MCIEGRCVSREVGGGQDGIGRGDKISLLFTEPGLDQKKTNKLVQFGYCCGWMMIDNESEEEIKRKRKKN